MYTMIEIVLKVSSRYIWTKQNPNTSYEFCLEKSPHGFEPALYTAMTYELPH